MSRRQVRNPFYFFMLDFMQREQKVGRTFPGGLKDVSADSKCIQEWQALSKFQKQVYRNIAKDEKYKVKELDKQTSEGELISQLENEQIENLKFYRNMTDNIIKYINSAVDNKKISTEVFYFIHVHYYYEREINIGKIEYEPAEFAIVRFNLKTGVDKICSKIMQCNLPMGFRLSYMDHANKTHRIIENYENAEKSYITVYDELISFINPTGDMKNLPPLYTSKTDTVIVQALIKKLADVHGHNLNFIPIYSIEVLYCSLYNHLIDEKMEVAFAEHKFENMTHLNAGNVVCSYHKSYETSYSYCSMSIVQNWVFMFCEHFCGALNIALKEGTHIPAKSLISDMHNLTVSNQSSSRTTYGRNHRRKESKTITIIDHSLLNQNDEAAKKVNQSFDPFPDHAFRPSGYAGKVCGSNSSFNIDDNLSFPPIQIPVEGVNTNSVLGHNYDEDFPHIGGKGAIPKFKGKGKKPPSHQGSRHDKSKN